MGLSPVTQIRVFACMPLAAAVIAGLPLLAVGLHRYGLTSTTTLVGMLLVLLAWPSGRILIAVRSLSGPPDSSDGAPISPVSPVGHVDPA